MKPKRTSSHIIKNRVQRTKHTRTSNRALHVRVALHPVNILFLLCAGILLVTSTFNAVADSYSITGTVPAPPLTQPAVITHPADSFTTNTQAISVTGTCPNASYVKLTDNSQYVGTSTCDNTNAFQVGLNLVTGGNVVYAQDYNVTDSPGPTGSSITVQNNPPPPPVPPPVIPSTANNVTATPTTLQILQDDTQVAYSSSGSSLPTVSTHPTFSGVAPPYSQVTVVVHSNSYTCSTTASAEGYWQCALPYDLPAGLHEVDVSARTPQGQHLAFLPFRVQVVSGPASTPSNTSTKLQLLLGSNGAIKIVRVGQKLTFDIATTGGDPPSAVSVSWGDGSTSTYLSKDATPFAITYTYGWISAAEQSKVVKVQAVDASGDVGSLQLVVELKNPGYVGVASMMTSRGDFKRILEAVKPWLWVFWPGYTVVLLAVFSFWLGERQEQLELLKPKHRKKSRRVHHAK